LAKCLQWSRSQGAGFCGCWVPVPRAHPWVETVKLTDFHGRRAERNGFSQAPFVAVRPRLPVLSRHLGIHKTRVGFSYTATLFRRPTNTVADRCSAEPGDSKA
jgi:hypothetical protein